MKLSKPTQELRLRLRRTWLAWSCLPLLGMLLVLAATTAVYASQPVLSAKRAEDSFYMFLAISALVFLFGFTIDGHWTNPQRIGETIRRQLQEKAGNGAGKGVSPEARAAVASRVIMGSVSALGLMGHVIGLIAVLCLLSGAGVAYAYLLLAVAVSYQLFIFSRHPYYEQVVEASYLGELESEKEDSKPPKEKKGPRRR
ncbi:MAG: hypothetical protein ACUVX8_01830 [Candidatus Zipacnadales bacterium]